MVVFKGVSFRLVFYSFVACFWCVRACVCLSTSLILSPADYQSILAELQSPAALHSEPHFLEPELPVTPNISPAHYQHHFYPETDPPSPATSHPHALHPCPVQELECSAGGPDSSDPRSPPRPCELTLVAPTFELPQPTAATVDKVRKPHIALNDQLLLSEEEDRSYQEMVPCRKARSPSHPTMCELDVEMAYSTSSPTLSSVSSVTPSSPEDGGAQIASPNGVQEDVVFLEGSQEVAAEQEKVVEIVAAELAQGNGLVDWVEQDLIKNVERKCEMITKDGCKLSEGSGAFAGQMGPQKENYDTQFVLSQDGTVVVTGEVQEERDSQGKSGEQRDVEGMEEDKMMEDEETAVEGYDETSKVETLQKGIEKENPESARLGEELQPESEEGPFPRSHRDTHEEPPEVEVVEDQVGSAHSPQGWVEALRECHDTDSESSEEAEKEEDGEEDTKVKEEPSKSLIEEVDPKEGSEEETKEDEETGEAAGEEVLGQDEQRDKDVCSLVGWHSDSSSVNVEPPTPGRSVSSDLLDRRER